MTTPTITEPLPAVVAALAPAVTDPLGEAKDLWAALKKHQPALAGALAMTIRAMPSAWPHRELGVTRPDATLTIPANATAPYDFRPEIAPYRSTRTPEDCPACHEAGEAGNYLCRWHTGQADAHDLWFGRLLAAVKADPAMTVDAFMEQYLHDAAISCGCDSCMAQASNLLLASPDTPDASNPGSEG